jgi:hypothetical protein
VEYGLPARLLDQLEAGARLWASVDARRVRRPRIRAATSSWRVISLWAHTSGNDRAAGVEATSSFYRRIT